MTLDSSQRAGGVTTVSDADISPVSAEERARKEQQFIEKQNLQSLARSRVIAKYGDMLKSLSSTESRDVTMGKLMDKEVALIEQEQKAASAPSAAEAAREAIPVTQEKPLSILEVTQWLEWDDKPYNAEVYPRFLSVFVPELAKALADMPTDMQKSTALMYQIEMLFKRKVFKMYLNAYPQIQGSDEVMVAERQLSGWLHERWAEVLAAARRFPPVR